MKVASQTIGSLVFRGTILVLTFFPILIALLLSNGVTIPGIVAGFTILFILSAAHVPGTIYLFFDSAIRKLVIDHPIKLIVVPLFLFILSLSVLTFAPLNYVLLFMFTFIVHQCWHFGKQNLGILAIACMSSGIGPLSTRTRHIITLGIIAGMLGSFSVSRPSFHTNSEFFQYSLAGYDNFFNLTYSFGLILLLLTAIFSVVDLSTQWRKLGPLNICIYLGSSLFFLPVFCGNDPAVTVMSYAISHGLQYVAFLAYLALGTAQATPEKSLTFWPLLTFLVAIAFGLLFITQSQIFAVASKPIVELMANYPLSDYQFLRSVSGVLIGVTFMHFWFDQSVWRLRDPERRSWFQKYYAMILPRRNP